MALTVSETDFDNIKQNLIDYLGAQDEFKDYDYTGSAMNVILDVLAYSTHYMSMHANMNINEMFLDTAKIRSSVVSKAKELGYTPKQYTSSVASVKLNIDLTGETIPADVSVIKGIRFTGSDEFGKTYNFATDTAYTLSPIGSDVFEGTVDIAEGVVVSETWTHDGNNPVKFILLNNNIDTTTLSVVVRDFVGSSNTTTKIDSATLTLLKQDTDVFFIQETFDDQVEIYFGDGTLGKDLVNGNVVEITYNTSLGSLTNKISKFSLINDIDGWGRARFTLTTTASASGGADRETTESIKHIAPKNYQAQNRAVTQDDYRAIILRENSNIKSSNVWGGETETPPKYGRFFISLRTADSSELSPNKKQAILDNISQYNVLTVKPEIVDPQQIYVDIVSTVTFNKNNTSFTAGQIQSKVTTAITDLFTTKLFDFNETFIYSELLSTIDDVDTSVIGNLTEVNLTYKNTSVTGSRTIGFSYSNALVESSFKTSSWTDNGSNVKYLFDKGDGKIYQNINSIDNAVAVGTVNYVTGDITISDYDFNVSNIEILYTADTVIDDISTNFNVLLNEGTVSVSVVGG